MRTHRSTRPSRCTTDEALALALALVAHWIRATSVSPPYRLRSLRHLRSRLHSHSLSTRSLDSPRLSCLARRSHSDRTRRPSAHRLHPLNVNVFSNSGSNGQTAVGQAAATPPPATYSNYGQSSPFSVTETSRTSLASRGPSMPGGTPLGLLPVPELPRTSLVRPMPMERSMPGGPPSGLLAPPPANTYEQYADLNGNDRLPSAVPMDSSDGGGIYLNSQVNGQDTNNLNSPSTRPSVPRQPPPSSVPNPQPAGLRATMTKNKVRRSRHLAARSQSITPEFQQL